jgi:hypothetical protein
MHSHLNFVKRFCLTAVWMLFFYVSSGQQTGWKEMDDFSLLSAKVFHPAEAGNLKPTRDSVSQLLAKVTAWQLSSVPTFCDAATIRPLLVKLVAQCNDIRDAVQANKRDQDLRTLVSRAHHTFHQIPSKCKILP